MIRKPFLMFITIVGFMLFFVLYIATSTTVPSSSLEYDALVSEHSLIETTTSNGSLSNKTIQDTITTPTKISQSPSANAPAVSEKNGTASSTAGYPEALSVEVMSSSEESPEESDLTSAPEALFQDDRPIPFPRDLSKKYDKYVIYEDTCRIRSYDYKDPALMKKYFSKEPKMCPKNAKPFFFYPVMNLTAGHSCVGVNTSVFNKSYLSEGGELGKWSCTYKEAIRNLNYQVIDKHYDFGKKKPLKAGDCPKEEFIWIECDRPGTNETYQQPLMLPLVKAPRAAIRPNNIGKKPLHVLVVGLDSVSRLNAHRQFPKTMEFLQSKKNLVELFGYNKIGVNSAPNQIPLLTGIPFASPGLKSRLGTDYFDNVTRYLWDDYEDRGYRTMFYEEQWIYGLFVYPSLKGFRKVRKELQSVDVGSMNKNSVDYGTGKDIPF